MHTFIFAFTAIIHCHHSRNHSLQTFTFASISPHLLSAPVHHTAPNKSSLNFFSRHTAIRHKIHEDSWKFIMKIRYICVFMLAWMVVWMFACMLGAEDLPLNVHVWRVHQCTRVHQMFWVLIFSVGTRQFGTKFMKIHDNHQWKLDTFVCLCLQNSYSFTLSSSAYSAFIHKTHM